MRGLLLLLLVACRSTTSTTGPCVADCEARCADKDGPSCAAAAEAAYNGYNGTPLDLAKSFRLSTQACELGDGFGCSLLGLHYQDGRGAPWDHALAVATYEKSCTLGAGTGCYNLESMYQGGHGVVVDHVKGEALHAKARAAWDAACHGPAPRWCTNLAFLEATDGELTKERRERVLALDKLACDHGVLVGCSQAALEERELGTLSIGDYVSRLDGLCTRGDPGACTQAGLALYLGEKGLPKDELRGSTLIRTGCRMGDKAGCAAAGVADLDATPPDADGALRDFTDACDRGDARACLGVGKDLAARNKLDEALAFAKRACRGGEKDGCATVALAYESGRGVAKDHAAAMTWASEGCSMGGGDMCAALVYEGAKLPVPADVEKKLYADACSHGVPKACEHGKP